MPSYPPRKLLVVRFSAMGDIVLTTPILRALAQGIPGAELHWLVKDKFAHVLAHNPHLHRIHPWTPQNHAALMDHLRAQRFHAMIDLQGSLRSLRISWELNLPRYTFDKRNLAKWWIVRTKRGSVPHIVERYAHVLTPLGLALDDQGLEFHTGPDAAAAVQPVLEAFRQRLPPMSQPPIAMVLGATHNTKKWPLDHMTALLNRLGLPVILLGGPAERLDADALTPRLTTLFLDAVGHHNLHESAELLRAAQFVITHDTGLMHIAAAFGKPILSIWGNTIPGFGMTPYRTPYATLEVPDLPCRPCSKIGYAKCPQGHFRCMWGNTPERALAVLEQHGMLL